MSDRNHCPQHGVMQRVETKFKVRWTCMHPGCTVRRWEGDTSTPADQQTCDLRMECHAMFDELWKSNRMSRHGAYRLLQKLMHLSRANAHIGMFDADQCRVLLERLPAWIAKFSAGEFVFEHLLGRELDARLENYHGESIAWVEAALAERERRANRSVVTQ